MWLVARLTIFFYNLNQQHRGCLVCSTCMPVDTKEEKT